MILPFQTKWPERMGELAGQPNYFIDKIWNGLLTTRANISSLWADGYYEEHVRQFGFGWDLHEEDPFPKLHTIRRDAENLWQSGMEMQMVFDDFQFAPVIRVKGVQEIEIMIYETDIRTGAYYTTFLDNYRYKVHQVRIDNRPVLIKECSELARNDGFPSVEAFFQYFNQDFKGKIIHFTDLKY